MTTAATPPKRLLAGPFVGVVQGLVMIGLLHFMYLESGVYTLYVAAFIAIFGLAPLLLVNLALTFIYLRRETAGATYVWMWLPSVAVYLAALGVDAAFTRQQQNDEAEHPAIREVHINLSGRSLWLHPDEAGNASGGRAELPGGQPENFRVLTRYPGGGDAMSAYRGARLASDFHNMYVFAGPPADTAPLLLQVRQSLYFPDVAAILPLLHYQGGESSLIQYAYYHYSEHIEVAATLSLSGSQRMDLWGSNLPVVDFYPVNLGRLPLARLEIDGQAIDLGDNAVPPESEGSCDYRQRNRAATTLLGKEQRLHLRWQQAQPDPVWHEASVLVPPFTGKRPPGRLREAAVELYFQADGSVVAEPSQLYERGDTLSLRLHATSPLLLREPACGRVAGRFSEDVKLLRE